MSISPACSSSSTVATMYGTRSTKNGWKALYVSVKEYTVPRPETSAGAKSNERQARQTGRGRWMYVPHAEHRWMRRRPSRAPAQKNAPRLPGGGIGGAATPWSMPMVDSFSRTACWNDVGDERIVSARRRRCGLNR